MTDLIKQIVRETIENKMCAWQKKPDGYYHEEIYADYRDEMEDSTLKEIMKSERPARNIPTPRTIDDMYAVSKGFANTTIANNASKSGTVTVFHDNGNNFLDVNSTNN